MQDEPLDQVPAAERPTPAADDQTGRRLALGSWKRRIGPRDDETANLVAEFHARGGRVTECPPGDAERKDTPVQRKRKQQGSK